MCSLSKPMLGFSSGSAAHTDFYFVVVVLLCRIDAVLFYAMQFSIGWLMLYYLHSAIGPQLADAAHTYEDW